MTSNDSRQSGRQAGRLSDRVTRSNSRQEQQEQRQQQQGQQQGQPKKYRFVDGEKKGFGIPRGDAQQDVEDVVVLVVAPPEAQTKSKDTDEVVVAVVVGNAITQVNSGNRTKKQCESLQK